MSIIIDKSRFTPAQLAQYEELVRIGKSDTAEPAAPAVQPPAKEEPVEKSASPELTAALERLATLEKSYEMQEFTKLAKKYAPLGEKEDELAKTLYDMKKSNEGNFNAYISALDKSLNLVEKSGMFAEIGKSSTAPATNGAVAKAEAKAAEIMKADPNIDHTTALAKAWEDPALMAEFDGEYFA